MVGSGGGFATVLLIGAVLSSLVLGGCDCGGVNQVQYTEDWTYVTAEKWDVRASVKTVDGWLILTSTPGHGAEIQSKETFQFGSTEIRVFSDNTWAVDTSIGWETWVDNMHRAVVLDNGCLGIINQAWSILPIDERYPPIPGWDALRNQVNVFRLVWASDRAELYANTEFKLAYPDAVGPGNHPPLPEIPMPVRLNASDQYTDALRADYVSVRDGAGTERLRSEFKDLDPAAWSIPKGSSATNWDHRLALSSSGNQGAEIQSKRAYELKTLKVPVYSDSWSPGTSFGFEFWDDAGRHSVIVTEGRLRIFNGASYESVDIAGWDGIKAQENLFTLVWSSDRVELYMNDAQSASAVYTGSSIPRMPLLLRFNASSSHDDELRVGELSVR